MGRALTLLLRFLYDEFHWALSSAVRAFGLHPKGRPFESDSAHHLALLKRNFCFSDYGKMAAFVAGRHPLDLDRRPDDRFNLVVAHGPALAKDLAKPIISHTVCLRHAVKQNGPQV